MFVLKVKKKKKEARRTRFIIDIHGLCPVGSFDRQRV